MDEDKLYFLSINNGPYACVNKKEWVRAERLAGFVNTMGHPDEPGTAGFSSTKYPGQPDEHSIEGSIIYLKYFQPENYDWKPALRHAVLAEIERMAQYFIDSKEES